MRKRIDSNRKFYAGVLKARCNGICGFGVVSKTGLQAKEQNLRSSISGYN